MPPQTAPTAPKTVELKTAVFREFLGVNQVDGRSSIDDKEFFWLENMLPIGKGQILVVPKQGASIATIAAGIRTIFGFWLNLTGTETPVIIAFNNDGSATQVNRNTGAQVSIAGAGKFTAGTRCALWKDTPILIIDPLNGYFTWDGSVLTTLTGIPKGTDIAVFEGRVWVVTGTRAVTFSAPNSFSDFTITNGGGVVSVSDSAFSGNIVRLLSALEQLWIVGPSGVDAISNVSTNTSVSPAVTTFSLTNIVTGVGTLAASSVTSFFRTFLLWTHFGVYAIVGSTPQKLSDKLDVIFPSFFPVGYTGNLQDTPAAIGVVNDVFMWASLVNSQDTVVGTGANRPLLLCFAQGKWFFSAQGNLKWITGLNNSNGTPEIWGTDGSTIYQVFGDTTNAAVAFVLKTKLWDFGRGIAPVQAVLFGIDVTSNFMVTLGNVKIENENRAAQQLATIVASNQVIWTNNSGATVTWLNNSSQVVNWIANGLQVVRQGSQGPLGYYLGMTLSATSAPFTLSMLAIQFKLAGDWNKVRP